jgi:branched-chain amino acid aminotransferase
MVERAPFVWVNDGLVTLDESRISPRDRGFALGDGIFETMSARQGNIPWLDLHLDRLGASARVIALHLPWTPAALKEAIAQTLAANQIADGAAGYPLGGPQGGVVRLSVSRGVPEARGLLPGTYTIPTLVIDVQPFHGYPAPLYERGMAAVTSDIVRNERSPLSGIKSLGYLENIMARQQAADRGADEAVLRNTIGELACASAANLFIITDRRLLTPDLASGALPGITAQIVLERLARRIGLEPGRTRIVPQRLVHADEAFLTSSLLGIMPLCAIDGEGIGAGQPGPNTLRLRQLLAEAESALPLS